MFYSVCVCVMYDMIMIMSPNVFILFLHLLHSFASL